MMLPYGCQILVVAALSLGLKQAQLLALAQPFHLPTANQALDHPEQGELAFVGTVGKPWTTGLFGCVRSEGRQFHEGIDIKCLERDSKGEPADAVRAAANGEVVYINSKPALSNYGIYLVLRHQIEELELYSLYAHLGEVRAGLTVGAAVQAGQAIAVMGRTANTGQGISRERAHLHFELNFYINDRFAIWHKKTFPDQRNDHGVWNGQNMLGIDPLAVFRGQAAERARFSLLRFVREQPEFCRVLVRAAHFPWLKRYAILTTRNPRAEREGIAGYELALNFIGIPFQVTPRAAGEMKGRAKFQLLSVNEAEHRQNPCRRLVRKRGQSWELTATGRNLMELLTF